MCSLYDLANVVPTLAKFYHQASEAYEQACTRHISMIIYYVSNSPQFFVLPSSMLPNASNIYFKIVHPHYVLYSNLNDFSSLLKRLKTWCTQFLQKRSVLSLSTYFVSMPSVLVKQERKIFVMGSQFVDMPGENQTFTLAFWHLGTNMNA